MKKVKIALVQINPVIGDFANNCSKVKKKAQEAYEGGSDVVIFSEMIISGYPPQDLLERKSFIQDHDSALQQLIKELPPIDIILGCIDSRVVGEGKPLFNAALIIRDNKIIQTVRKQLLPSYDVFDEKRYFEPGTPSEFYTIGDKSFAITICEDIWQEEVGEYDFNPVEEVFTRAKEQNVKLDGLINISASPFQKDKGQLRQDIFTAICTKYNTSLIYVNQVGGQDSLLFDGRSMVMDVSGKQSVTLPAFEEHIEIFDFNTIESGSELLHESRPEVGMIYDALVMGVRDYVNKCGFKSVVLGLSGGIDSALTAVIAVDALGEKNVLGVALPSMYSSEGSIEDAKELTKNIKCKFEIIPIKGLFESFQSSLGTIFEGLKEDVTEQNIQARIRGNLLMALSNKFGDLLLTTGNKSEMAVGYCTLYGDMSGGLAVISDLPKGLVYKLSHYVNRSAIRIPTSTITKPPSAELKPDQYDQDDLPDYAILDAILELHLEKGKGIQEIVDAGHEKLIVEDTLRRVRINEYKRKQAPMGLKVTTKAFGYGRRYPNVQNYRG